MASEPQDYVNATAAAPENAREHTRDSGAGLEPTHIPAPPSTVVLSPPCDFGAYRIEAKLGEGGMGAVYRARHIKLDKLFALKILPRHLTDQPVLVERFEREMKAVGKLEHPHIVRASDAGQVEGTHYLVLEYVEGQDLSKLVRERGVRSVAESCELIRQAAMGLAHAHQHGLVHRDIKPSNLLVTHKHDAPASGRTSADNHFGEDTSAESNRTNAESNHSLARRARPTLHLKILDLGLALLQGESVSQAERAALTKSGQVLGTPDYMAPEQWDDTHGVDHRADLYSLGCTLFFLLTGHAPYSDGQHVSINSKLKGHVLDEIPDLQSARRAALRSHPHLPGDEVPDDLAALYRRLLAKKPEDRFQSAEELANALKVAITAPRDEQNVAVTAPRDEPRAIDSRSPTDPPNHKHDAPASGTVTNDLDHSLARRAGLENTSLATQPLLTQSVETQGSSRGAMTATLKRRLIVAVLGVAIVLTGILIKLTNKDTRVTEPKVAVTAPRDEPSEKTAPSPNAPNAKPDSESLPPKGSSRGSVTATLHDRSDWPEWAKEMREPPPLEEWLQGRKVLTVKQDGSAMFQTIQAALDKVQPGEVIRVLDKGPYRERLVKRIHPGDFGVITEDNTVIELATWELEPTLKSAWIGHLIDRTGYIRIAGFTFVCTMPVTEQELIPAPVPHPIYFQESAGICLENCVVLAPQTKDEPRSNVTSRAILRRDAADTVCIRDCALGLFLRSPAIGSQSFTTLFLRNFFCGQQEDYHHLSFGLAEKGHRVIAAQNIFDCRSSRHALAMGAENSVAGEGNILLTSNTLALHHASATLSTGNGVPGRQVVIQDNLLSASTLGFLFHSDARPFAAKAREEWIVRNNWGGRRETLPDWVPLTDPAHTGELPYLSLDPEHPNFLRLDPAKLPNDAKNIPGALPPGPPPPAGDWFTRLQSRLKEAQAASQAQFK